MPSDSAAGMDRPPTNRPARPKHSRIPGLCGPPCSLVPSVRVTRASCWPPYRALIPAAGLLPAFSATIARQDGAFFFWSAGGTLRLESSSGGERAWELSASVYRQDRPAQASGTACCCVGAPLRAHSRCTAVLAVDLLVPFRGCIPGKSACDVAFSRTTKVASRATGKHRHTQTQTHRHTETH